MVAAPDDPDGTKRTVELVEQLMGRKPELRLAFIQETPRRSVSSTSDRAAIAAVTVVTAPTPALR